MILINFKNYTSGKKTIELAKLIKKSLPSAIVVVSDLDVRDVAAHVNIHVFAQHVDYFKTNRATGFAIPEKVKSAGAEGTLLNHSEHPLTDETIARTIKRTNETGLRVVLCAPTLKRAKSFMKFSPYAIAFEDPKLVGSGKSITEHRSNDVEKFSKLLQKTKIIPLCGAGISSAQDVKKARELGCKGVLIASAVANVPLKRAEKILREISLMKNNN